MFSRSAIRPGPVGCHPSRFLVIALEAGRSRPANAASHPKWAGASSGSTEITDTFSPRPMTSAMSRIGTPFFGHCVIPSTFLQFLKRQPEGTGRIEDMHRRPAVAPVAHIGGNALLASEFNHISDEPLLDSVVNLGKAHNAYAHAVCRDRNCRLLRGRPWNGLRALREILFCGRPARHGVCYARSGGDEQWPVRAGQRRAQGLYDALSNSETS